MLFYNAVAAARKFVLADAHAHARSGVSSALPQYFTGAAQIQPTLSTISIISAQISLLAAIYYPKC